MFCRVLTEQIDLSARTSTLHPFARRSRLIASASGRTVRLGACTSIAGVSANGNVDETGVVDWNISLSGLHVTSGAGNSPVIAAMRINAATTAWFQVYASYFLGLAPRSYRF